MGVLSRVVGVLIGVALLAGVGTAWGDGGRPDVSSTSSSDVTASGAVLKATVHPNGNDNSAQFEYGLTTAYGSQTAAVSVDSQGSAQPVTIPVDGLQPSTTYHFRAVATNDKGTTRGPDKTFTTLAAPPGGTPDGGGEPPQTTTPGTATAELGSSVLVAPASGDVLVRRPGASSFVALELGAELPVGTEFDTRAGTVALTAALPSGATQTGNFGGGRFKVRQDRRGYVDLYLRGRYCSDAQGSTISTAATGSRPGRRLWGRDRGGRFRTHGRNSHATVRGTRWLVADTCKGTLTRVTNGSVVVRDTVRDKRVVLDAGERYLARPRR
jgi:hypothetical protein